MSDAVVVHTHAKGSSGDDDFEFAKKPSAMHGIFDLHFDLRVVEGCGNATLQHSIAHSLRFSTRVAVDDCAPFTLTRSMHARNYAVKQRGCAARLPPHFISQVRPIQTALQHGDSTYGSHGTPGSSERSDPRRAYSGRKPEPHASTQCASSTTIRWRRLRLESARRRWTSLASRILLWEHSAEALPERRQYLRSASRTCAASTGLCVEQRLSARIRNAAAASTWSLMRASKGTMTTLSPGVASAAS
eukprot:scaffold3768_cov33-Tisochrysis_lutea.AAC.1